MSNEENHSDNLEKAHDCIYSVTHYDLFKLVEQLLELKDTKETQETKEPYYPDDS